MTGDHKGLAGSFLDACIKLVRIFSSELIVAIVDAKHRYKLATTNYYSEEKCIHAYVNDRKSLRFAVASERL